MLAPCRRHIVVTTRPWVDLDKCAGGSCESLASHGSWLPSLPMCALSQTRYKFPPAQNHNAATWLPFFQSLSTCIEFAICPRFVAKDQTALHAPSTRYRAFRTASERAAPDETLSWPAPDIQTSVELQLWAADVRAWPLLRRIVAVNGSRLRSVFAGSMESILEGNVVFWTPKGREFSAWRGNCNGGASLS